MDDMKSVFDVINLSGHLINSDGVPFPDGVYDINLAIFTEAEGGKPVWSQWLESVKVSQGMFQVPVEKNAIPLDPLQLGLAYLEVQVGKEAAQGRQKLNLTSVDDKTSPTMETPVIHADGAFTFLSGLVPNSIPSVTQENTMTATVVGRVPVSAAAWGIDASDGYVYVTTLNNDFIVIDAHNPSQPRIITSMVLNRPTAGAVRLVKSGDYAYVLMNNNEHGMNSGLMVVDVSQPTQPSVVGQWRYDLMVDELAVSGDHAVVSPAVRDLQVITLEKGLPVLAGSVRLSHGFAGVDLAGQYAYAVTARDPGNANSSGSYFYVIDVSKPGQPLPVGQVMLHSNHAAHVRVSGLYAYAVGLKPGALAGEDQAEGEVINISNPAAPVVVARFNVISEPTSLWLMGRYLYCIAAESDVLQVIDVSDPKQPVSYEFDLAVDGAGTGGGHIYGSVSNGYAYLVSASTGILRIIRLPM